MIPERDGEGKQIWLEYREERRSKGFRWSLRAAQWRALEIARTIFGRGAGVRLGSYGPGGGFHGLVYLRVPFHGLDDHLAREARFTRLAGADELLARVPLVFIFEAAPPTDRPTAPAHARGEAS
jgi:hypothetical protein